jgi:hypothetical protein
MARHTDRHGAIAALIDLFFLIGYCSAKDVAIAFMSPINRANVGQGFLSGVSESCPLLIN